MSRALSSQSSPSQERCAAPPLFLTISLFIFTSQVFSIVIKYNCVENNFSHRFAFVWGVLFPWIISIPLLYQPDALNQFINFSSLIFVSFTDFIVPWALYIVLQRKEAKMIGQGISPEVEFALPADADEVRKC